MTIVDRRLAIHTLANAVSHLNNLFSRDAYADYEAVKLMEKIQFNLISGFMEN